VLAALLVAVATGLATTLGALPFLVQRDVARRSYDALLGLGAGLMLAAATLGLLSTALEGVRARGGVDGPRLAAVLAGFVAGVLLLYLMDRLIPHEHAGGHGAHVHDDHVHPVGDAHAHHEGTLARKQGWMVVGVMSLHRLPEGFAIGAAWAAGGEALGLQLVLAVAVQNAVEGAVMAAPLRRGGMRAPQLLALIAATGMTVPAAALAGYALSSHVAGALPPMLALAAGALIYLTCNEVIPESHSHGNEVRATFGVLAGFLFIILLRVLLGHEH
jgi:ZIP family zinc transporter